MTPTVMSAGGDAELCIYAVDEYCFQDKDNYQLVCFSTLPLRFADDDAVDVPKGNRALDLMGCTDGGLGLHVYKEVVAWRLELDGDQPQVLVLVLVDGGGWLRLAKPSMFYERTVARTVLMTAQVLYFLRRNPDGPDTALWIHLRQVFGKFWPRPQEDDFRNQTSLSLMRQFAARDPVLANSEVCGAYSIDEDYFEAKDSNYELVCFSTLPLRFGDATADAVIPKGNKALYLSGCTNRGLRLELKEVVAWRLELDGEQPEFFVLPPANSGGWLRLGQAKKLYERTARTVLMTSHMLHFLKRNPDGLETALWIHLRQAFGNFWPRPSEEDFRNQTSLSLMRQFAATDPILANSWAFRAFAERISAEVGGGADIVYIADDGEVIN